MPKITNACSNNNYEIYIVFLNEISNTSFIGFRIKASKETFEHESNLLLLFLKKSSKKVIFYLMNNNYIHVQCRINDAWELFYHLYDEYLRRYVFTIIGTQFFFSFASSYCMQKERQLLEMLYKGSKVIKVSRKSVYYKVHKKRKISVTDLIHMTHNMPRTKKHAISCYNFRKPPIRYRDGKKKFCTTPYRKSMTNTLKAKRSCHVLPYSSDKNFAYKSSALLEEIPVPLDSAFTEYTGPLTIKDESYRLCEQKPDQASLKRKLQDMEYSGQTLSTSSKDTLFKFPETVKTDEWEKYSDFKSYSVESYSDLSCIRNIVPKLLNDKSRNFPNYYEYEKHSNILIQNKMLPSVSSASEIYEEEKDIPVTKTRKDIFEGKFSPVSKIHRSTGHATKFLGVECSESHTQINVQLINNVPENFNQDSLNDVSFTTGAGKAISISNSAMVAAHKLMNDMLCDSSKISSETSDPVCKNKVPKYTNSFSSTALASKNNAVDLQMSSSNTARVNQIPTTKCLENKKTLSNLSIFYDDIESESDILSFDDVDFTTAAGTNITVSDTAIEAAQKIIHGMLTEDSKQISDEVPKYGAFRNKSSNIFQDAVCSSKTSAAEGFDDVDMDKTLVEKFFEDTIFDEKELETVAADDKYKVSSTVGESNSNQNVVPRKIRKSLGGRRSMRYSDKL